MGTLGQCGCANQKWKNKLQYIENIALRDMIVLVNAEISFI